MSKIKASVIPAFLISTVLLVSAAAQVTPPPYTPRPLPPPPDPLTNSQTAVTDDWLTISHDAQRSGWNNGDSAFNPGNVSGLKLLWSTQLPTTPSPNAGQTLTSPVVVAGVNTKHGVKTLAYTISGDSKLFAIDVDTGKIFWQKAYLNPIPPVHPQTGCAQTPSKPRRLSTRAKALFTLRASTASSTPCRWPMAPRS